MRSTKKVIQLTIVQKYLILLLGALNFKPLRGKTWLQKEMFLLSRNIENLRDEIYFEPHHYGPYSELLDQELENLEILGIVELNDKIKLTDVGRKVYTHLVSKLSPDELELVREIRSELDDLTEEELLALIYFSYPKMTKESRVLDRILKNREKIAVKLYLKEKVSLAKAAEIAGKGLSEFIRYLKKQGTKIPLSY